jgi:integrase
MLNSNFKDSIIDFVNEKRKFGYTYQSEEKLLRHFDEFCLKNCPSETFISQFLLEEFRIYISVKHPNVIHAYASIINEFSKFLNRNGIKSSFISSTSLPKRVKYTPYIFSDDELKSFFSVCDSIASENTVNSSNLALPLFFRTLYITGMRITECSNLKLEDVNFDNGTILIKHSKNNKERLIPISKNLLNRFSDFFDLCHKFSEPDALFFWTNRESPLCNSRIRYKFHEIRQKAKIPYFGRPSIPGKIGGPRVHDFRHTFAVHCLRRWVFDNMNINALLPVLQAYLGHTCYNATAYYLHLTAELFPDIVAKSLSFVGDIIPNLESNEND